MRWWLDHLHAWQAHETDFMKLRQLAGITRQEVATLCAVKEATVRHWEAGNKPPPRAIVLLLHLSGGQLGVLDPAWQDWCLRAGQLWAPQLLGQGFRPEHLKVYEYALQERDALRRELDKARAAASTEQRPGHDPGACLAVPPVGDVVPLKSGHQGGNERPRCHAVRATPGTPGQAIALKSVDAGLPLPHLPMKDGVNGGKLLMHEGKAGACCEPIHPRGTLVEVGTSPGSLRSQASADPPRDTAKPAGRHPALATPRDRASGHDGANPAPARAPAVN